MSGSGGSVVVRRHLGKRLRALRQRAGKSHADVSAAGLASRAKINRIENGRIPVKIADVRALCWLYSANEAATDALAALAPGTQEDVGWESASLPVWFELFAGLEATASRIRAFDPDLVNGLLQTPDYAAAVIGVEPGLSPEVVGSRVRFRMERQKVGADVTVILGEGALLLAAGGPQVLTAQIEHLRSDAHPNIRVRVVPFAAGAYPKRGNFSLFEFDDEEDPAVVYVEGAGAAKYLDKPSDWTDYETVWDILTQKSIPIGEWKR